MWATTFIGFGLLVVADVLALLAAFALAAFYFEAPGVGAAVAIGGFTANRMVLAGAIAFVGERGGRAALGAVLLGTAIWLAWIATGSRGVDARALQLAGMMVATGGLGALLGAALGRLRGRHRGPRRADHDQSAS